jgi:hypothetical protein
MPVGIAHHCKVSHDAANIHGRLNQNILLSRQLSNPIDFFATVALESEVIQAGLHFILDDDQDEDWIFSRGSGRTEPDVMPPLDPPIPHDGKAA